MATTKTTTKGVTKGIKGTTRTVKVSGDAEAPASPAGGGRLRLKSSHATQAAAPRAKTSPAPLPAPARAPSIPPRARKTTKAAAVPAPSAATEAGQLAIAIAAAAIDKKASNVEIIDLGGKADYADYLVVMTAGSDRHVRAVADGIEQSLHPKAVPLSVEGLQGGTWVLIDFGNVVAHVFQDSVRALYDIEGLWLDAARVPIPEPR